MSKIIFLDIDGVLQPLGSSKRLFYDVTQAVGEAVYESGDEAYMYMDPYDVAAAKYDWHPKAMENLRSILVATGAVIIMESDWRIYTDIYEMRLLFKLWKLDKYIEGILPSGDKQDVIDAYLKDHPETEAWVVVDDIDLGYKDKQVIPQDFLTEEDAIKISGILGQIPNASKVELS